MISRVGCPSKLFSRTFTFLPSRSTPIFFFPSLSVISLTLPSSKSNEERILHDNGISAPIFPNFPDETGDSGRKGCSRWRCCTLFFTAICEICACGSCSYDDPLLISDSLKLYQMDVAHAILFAKKIDASRVTADYSSYSSAKFELAVSCLQEIDRMIRYLCHIKSILFDFYDISNQQLYQNFYPILFVR